MENVRLEKVVLLRKGEVVDIVKYDHDDDKSVSHIISCINSAGPLTSIYFEAMNSVPCQLACEGRNNNFIKALKEFADDDKDAVIAISSAAVGMYLAHIVLSNQKDKFDIDVIPNSINWNQVKDAARVAFTVEAIKEVNRMHEKWSDGRNEYIW